VRYGYGMAGGYFTDVMLHTRSSKNYHQERATELRPLSKAVTVACGAVMLRFDGDSCPNSNVLYLRVVTTK